MVVFRFMACWSSNIGMRLVSHSAVQDGGWSRTETLAKFAHAIMSDKRNSRSLKKDRDSVISFIPYISSEANFYAGPRPFKVGEAASFTTCMRWGPSRPLTCILTLLYTALKLLYNIESFINNSLWQLSRLLSISLDCLKMFTNLLWQNKMNPKWLLTF